MKTILLVDDSFIARHSIKTLLSGEDYAILMAKGGQEALDLIKSEKPQVILLDLLMPHPDGMAVLEELKQHTHAPPIIVLSADIQETTQQRCFALGAANFLRKPPRREDLISAIEELV